MSTILYDLKSELRRLMIAGGELASGDARLKKLNSTLSEMAKSAPVLKKLSEQTAALTEPSNKERIKNLMEEAVLLNAVLYTQAKTGKIGGLLPLKTHSTINIMDVTHRMAKELTRSLTTTGSGRYEVVKQAVEDGWAFDTRFMPLFAADLDDKYAELAELIRKILPKFGPEVAPYILKDLDISLGTEANVRRVGVLGDVLSDEKSKELFINIYNDGDKKLKEAVIPALATYPEYRPVIDEAFKAKTSGVRTKAAEALARIGDEKALEMLTEGVASKNYSAVISGMMNVDRPELAQIIIDDLEKCKDKPDNVYYEKVQLLTNFQHAGGTTVFILCKIALDNMAKEKNGGGAVWQVGSYFNKMLHINPKDTMDWFADNYGNTILTEYIARNIFAKALDTYKPEEFYEKFHNKKQVVAQLNSSLTYMSHRNPYEEKIVDERWFDLVLKEKKTPPNVVAMLTSSAKGKHKKALSEYFISQIKKYDKDNFFDVLGLYALALSRFGADTKDKEIREVYKYLGEFLDKPGAFESYQTRYSINDLYNKILSPGRQHNYSSYSHVTRLAEFCPSLMLEVLKKYADKDETMGVIVSWLEGESLK